MSKIDSKFSLTKKIGDKVHVFLTRDFFDEKSPILVKDIIFLADAIVENVEGGQVPLYYLKIKKIFINKCREGYLTNTVHCFHALWVERGEEAFKLISNPSVRVKVD